MSLDISLTVTQPVAVYEANITHNLTEMAREAGIYELLWRPETVGISRAAQLIEPLERGYWELDRYPEKYQQFNPPDGWGDYESLLRFVEKYIAACKRHPEAEVYASR